MSPLKIENLQVTITAVSDNEIACTATQHAMNTQFKYHTHAHSLKFNSQNALSQVILKYQFQFNKIIRSAIKGKLKVGQLINCVFIDDFRFLNANDYNQYIRVDRRNNGLQISSSISETAGLHKLYTDGSFAEQTGRSGYGGIIAHPNGKQEIFNKSFAQGNSNLMELMAVIDGLTRLQNAPEIQVLTDSRFVIRGMAQWMHFWRFNQWQTAYGKPVKFAQYWQQLNQLCEGKFIEFKWIKGHSGHTKQSYCHQLAQKSAGIPNHKKHDTKP